MGRVGHCQRSLPWNRPHHPTAAGGRGTVCHPIRHGLPMPSGLCFAPGEVFSFLPVPRPDAAPQSHRVRRRRRTVTPEPCSPMSGDAGSTLMSSGSGLNSPSLAACSLSLAGSGLILLGLVTAQENQSAARQTDCLADCKKAIMINTLSKSHYSHMCHIIYPN